MTIINFDEVLQLKNECKDKFNEHVHFHDTCGGQYFTLETDSDDIRDFIKKFMLKKNYKVIFDKTKMSFTLESV